MSCTTIVKRDGLWNVCRGDYLAIVEDDKRFYEILASFKTLSKAHAFVLGMR